MHRRKDVYAFKDTGVDGLLSDPTVESTWNERKRKKKKAKLYKRMKDKVDALDR